MRHQSIQLTRTCPVCGSLGRSEAKLPMSASRVPPVFDLDDMAGLVRRQDLSLMLALVELLPYKQFTCASCRTDFRMESRSTKELVEAMLVSMQPVLPASKPGGRAPATRQTRPASPSFPGGPPPKTIEPPAEAAWEVESLDALFDYHVEEEAGDAQKAPI